MFTIPVLLSLATTVAAAGGKNVYNLSLTEAYHYTPAKGNQYFDLFWFADVSIGTPPQKFLLLPDTGSPDTFVQGKKLFSGPIYKPGQSSTFVNESKPWLFEYAGPIKKFITFASGYVAKETISVGSGKTDNLLSLSHTTFAVGENSTTGLPFAQGILGITHDAHSSSYNRPPFISEAVKRGKLEKDLFSVRLRRAQDASPAPPSTPGNRDYQLRKDAGNILVGAVDESQYKGAVTYVPIQPYKGFWQFAIDGVYLNGKLIKTSANHNSIVDTGTNGLVLSPKVAAEIFKQLGGTQYTKPPIGQYILPCNTTIDLKIKLGGTLFPIKAQDLNSGYANSKQTKCYTAITGVRASNANTNGTYPSKASDVLVLGTTFLVNTYTIFEYSHGGRLGVAELKDNGNLPAVAPLDIAEKR